MINQRQVLRAQQHEERAQRDLFLQQQGPACRCGLAHWSKTVRILVAEYPRSMSFTHDAFLDNDVLQLRCNALLPFLERSRCFGRLSWSKSSAWCFIHLAAMLRIDCSSECCRNMMASESTRHTSTTCERCLRSVSRLRGAHRPLVEALLWSCATACRHAAEWSQFSAEIEHHSGSSKT